MMANGEPYLMMVNVYEAVGKQNRNDFCSIVRICGKLFCRQTVLLRGNAAQRGREWKIKIQS